MDIQQVNYVHKRQVHAAVDKTFRDWQRSSNYCTARAHARPAEYSPTLWVVQIPAFASTALLTLSYTSRFWFSGTRCVPSALAFSLSFVLADGWGNHTKKI